MISKKICMLGAFAVGKTSLVSRFVTSMFSEKYQTTVGVKIDKKPMQVDSRDVTLVVWDLAGEDELIKVRTSYLRGAAGYLLVVDGTRRDTLTTAIDLTERVRDEIGELPFVLLLNKYDLRGEWEMEEAEMPRLFNADAAVVHTSAKTGENVEFAFTTLARRLLETP